MTTTVLHRTRGCGATSLFFARACAKLLIPRNNRKEVIQCLSALSRGVPRPCRPLSRPGTLLVRRPLSRCKPERGFRTALELRKRPRPIGSTAFSFLMSYRPLAYLRRFLGVLPRFALLEDAFDVLPARPLRYLRTSYLRYRASRYLSACLFALPERIFDPVILRCRPQAYPEA